jgi:LCP family protein required for cell wall assembly
MFSRYFTCLLVLLVAVAGCSGDAVPPDSRPAPSTSAQTTTTTAETTTTAPPFAVSGAPDELMSLIEQFYTFATRMSDQAPAAVPAILDLIPVASVETPTTGVASIGRFMEAEVAVIEMDEDVFLTVNDGSGWRIVGGRWPSMSVPAYFGETPRLVLVAGSDARPGEDPAATRADSVHIAALDGSGAGALVGIPRDSWVNVPGIGNRKFTASLAIGGPPTMLETIREVTGLPVEGYVLTGFVGFQEMLGNVLGGISMSVPRAIQDSASGADFDPGDQYLNGPNALALARARKTLPGGDFTRSEHQGLILLATARTVRAMGYAAIPRLMEMSEPWLLTDLTAEQLLTFSALLIETNPESIPNVVAPGTVGTAGGASVVFLTDEAEGIWVDLADGRLEP